MVLVVSFRALSCNVACRNQKRSYTSICELHNRYSALTQRTRHSPRFENHSRFHSPKPSSRKRELALLDYSEATTANPFRRRRDANSFRNGYSYVLIRSNGSLFFSTESSDGDSNPGLNDANTRGWNAVVRALVGNCIITVMKFGVAMQTGSSAMFSEAVHTLADCGNQAFLLKGLSEASNAPDKRHQYGYGKAAFFWALISALGMFWTGAGVSFYHGAYQLINPPVETFEPGLSLWGVLGVSFAVDGYVLKKTLDEVNLTKPNDISLLAYLKQVRDPFVLAVIMEDFAACTGVLIASAGIIATHVTGDIFWDSLASIGIGGVLAVVAARLVSMNRNFLLGQSVDKETLDGIKEILRGRNAIESVYGVQSQWVGPSTFSYKAEVDFDGSYLAARLQKKYQPRFERGDEPLDVLLSWYAEDVTRLVELEVRAAEEEIKRTYPGAAFIELEPDSRNADDSALPKRRDALREATVERRSLNRFIQMVNLTSEKDGNVDK